MLNKKIVDLIKKAKRVGLFLKEGSTFEIAYSVVITYQILVKENINVDVFISQKETNIISLLKSFGISPISEITESKYIVKINYDKYPLEKVSYDMDKANKQLVFYLQPKDNNFDFDEIDFIKGGTNYDLFIMFDLCEVSDLCELYYENSEIINQVKKIFFYKTEKEIQSEDIIKLTKNINFTYQVKEILLKIFESEDIYNDIVLKSYLSFLPHRKVIKKQTDEHLRNLLEKENDISLWINDSFMSYSKNEVLLFSKMGQSIVYDEKNKVITLSISKEDLDSIEIRENDIKSLKKNPLNISKEIIIFIEAFEILKDKLFIKISSNYPDKYPAKKVAQVFNGKGSNKYSEFILENIELSELQNIVEPIMTDLYFNE